jgi:hypothetical protein
MPSDRLSRLGLTPRGIAVMLGSLVLVWSLTGGETARCEATFGGWECVRTHDGWVLRALGWGTERIDSTQADHVGLASVSRHSGSGHAAMISGKHSKGMRLVFRPTEEAAEGDEAALRAFIQDPRTPLVLHAPDPLTYRVGRWGLTALVLGGIVYATVEWLRGRA